MLRGLLWFVAVLAGLFYFSPVPTALCVFSQGYLSNGPLLFFVQYLLQMSALVPCVVNPGDRFRMAGCDSTEMVIQMNVAAHGWEGAGAGIKDWNLGLGGQGTVNFGHKQVASFYEEGGNSAQNKDIFVLVPVKTLLDKQLVPEGLFPLVINMDTDDPEHIKRRNLFNDMFPALHKPPQFELKAVPGVEVTGLQSFGAINNAVGYSLFKMLFDIELTADQLALLDEWNDVMAKYAVGMGFMLPFAGKSTTDALLKIVTIVADSKIGNQFRAVAQQKGMDPDARLLEWVFITLFAGYGGTSHGTSAVLLALSKSPKMLGTIDPSRLSLFRKDKKAFVIEAIRLNSLVIPCSSARKDRNLTLGNGRVHLEKKGDFVANSVQSANLDPTVFGGPSKSMDYSREFRPGRANADRMMTWNGELRHIEACGSSVTCPGSARPCPGTRLAIHIATVVTTFFADTLEAKTAGMGEL